MFSLLIYLQNFLYDVRRLPICLLLTPCKTYLSFWTQREWCLVIRTVSTRAKVPAFESQGHVLGMLTLGKFLNLLVSYFSQ